MTPVINEKNIETERVSIFWLDVNGLQYTLIERFFPKCSFQVVGKEIFIQQFYRACS
jgi:hypothetical protein